MSRAAHSARVGHHCHRSLNPPESLNGCRAMLAMHCSCVRRVDAQSNCVHDELGILGCKRLGRGAGSAVQVSRPSLASTSTRSPMGSLALSAAARCSESMIGVQAQLAEPCQHLCTDQCHPAEGRHKLGILAVLSPSRRPMAVDFARRHADTAGQLGKHVDATLARSGMRRAALSTE